MHAQVENRNHTLLTLGNLAIITQSLNASIRDASWVVKAEKDDMKNRKGKRDELEKYSYGIETLAPYLKNDVWDEATIYKRAEDLANMAIRVWPI